MAITRMLVIWCLLTGFAPLNAGATKTAETILISQDNSPIPFKLLRNKIIVPIRVNNSKELNIILDTGMPSDGLLLFDKNLADELELVGAKRFRISGAGKGKVSYALRVESALLTLSGNDFENQSVLILEGDTMHGFLTDGVIGHTLFGSHVVQIDYDTKVITLIEPTEFKTKPTWEQIPITFNDHGIPFVNAAVSISGEKEIDVFLYIDLASSEALELLVKPDMKFLLPEGLTEKYLGRGLDGDICGQFGRISSFRIGSFVLHDVPTAFPQAAIRSRQQGADGILCDNALRRFNLIFDYSRAKLYIKPNGSFHESFVLN
jgi:hypothetical protein